MTCDAGLFAKVRADDIYCNVGADEAVTCLFIAVDGAEAWAEVTIPQMGVGEGAFAGGFNRGKEEVAGNVVVEEKGWSEMERPNWDEAAVALGGCKAGMGWHKRSQARCGPQPGTLHHAILVPCLRVRVMLCQKDLNHC